MMIWRIYIYLTFCRTCRCGSTRS